MARRKIISMTEGIRNALVPSNLVSNSIVDNLNLSGRITDMYDRMQQEALTRYNADNFQAPVISQPDFNFSVPIEFPTKKSAPKSKAYSMLGSQFTNNLYNAYKTELINSGTRETDANRLALMLTRQSAMETGFGKHIAANHNYGGHRVNGKYINYKDDADYARAHIKLLDKKWSSWRTANNDIEFGKAIHTGNQKYSEIKGSDYGQRMSGTSNKVNDYLNMGRRKLRCGGKVSRPKAFLGAIATVANVAGGLIKNIMAKNQREYDAKVQLANQKYAMGVKEAAAMTEALNQSRDYQENYLNQFRMPYAGGGRRSKISGDVKLTAGGPALNLSTGRLYHYGEELPNGRYIDFGPNHETKNEHGGTGTDWRVNGKPIETKGGEVIDIDNSEMFVYSDDNKVGIPTDKGRIAPADAILSGIDTQFVRNIQQMQNGNFGDTRGTRRRLRNIKGKPYGKDHALIMAMEKGGKVTRPVEEIVPSPISGIRRNMANGGRIKAEGGIKVKYDKDGRPWREVKVKNPDGSTSFKMEYIDGITGETILNTNRQGTAGGGIGGGVRGVNRPSSQSSYAKQKAATNQPSRGASVGTGRRRLANASARLNITPFTPGGLPRDIYDNRTPYEIMRDNGFTEQGKNVIAPLEEDTVQRETPVNLNRENDLDVNVSANSNRPDWFNIGLTGLNIGGKLLGGLLTDRSLRNMPTPTAPLSYSAAKLPTVYNITPQLAQNQLLRSRLMSDANESSSSIAKSQRRNYANTYVNMLNNNLFGEKTNKENELLAADALNSQAQYTRSISDYNNFLKSYNDYENQRNLLRINNRDNMISGIVGAINDYDAQRRQNASDRLAMNWYLSTLKDEDRRYFLRNAGRNLVRFS